MARLVKILPDADVIVKTTVNLSANTFSTPYGKQLTLMDSVSGDPSILHQRFTMEWVDIDENRREILFKGLTGTLAGKEGKPGVFFNKNINKLKINLLLSRPDGTFSIVCDGTLYMMVAPPDSQGLPDPGAMEFSK